ncbi:MAG: exopolysaccharide biosynthesis protein [Verrucomicrobia bacterium]|nr:exopolysaccharide biosynthesis protein [Verrucomicrobiota bacterium]
MSADAFPPALAGRDELGRPGIASGGLLLALPIPIPFANAVPAWTVVFLAAGIMQRDGLLVLLGHLMTLGSWAFIGLCWLLGTKSLDRSLEHFSLFSLSSC